MAKELRQTEAVQILRHLIDAVDAAIELDAVMDPQQTALCCFPKAAYNTIIDRINGHLASAILIICPPSEHDQ
jgi:hypothetical protein